jgi:hypothetical protein
MIIIIIRLSILVTDLSAKKFNLERLYRVFILSQMGYRLDTRKIYHDVKFCKLTMYLCLEHIGT